MAARKTRIRHMRRDRRKAKASGFAREGKVKWGNKVGHGAGTAGRGVIVVRSTAKKPPKSVRARPPAAFSIQEVWPAEA